MHAANVCTPAFCFNPRSRRGSDCIPDADVCMARLFQSTLPQGERPSAGTVQDLELVFQSTLPQGERLAGRAICIRVIGFNPRSRRGSDIICRQHAPSRALVSIHAPAGGATAGLRHRGRYDHVSIHAPAGGATRLRPGSPRKQVSIHAPAGGATAIGDTNTAHNDCFNPRSRRGSDIVASRRRPLHSFNPRSRRGSDRLSLLTSWARLRFNPRSRRGSDSGT